MQKTIICIPARYASTRLPGKPLIEIAGISLIQRVWQIAKSVRGVDGVYVATDDQRIAEHVHSFGGIAVMTASDLENGTERCRAALDAGKIDADIVLNLQGDAPLTPPWVIEALVKIMQDTSIEMATPALALEGEALAKFLEEKRETPQSGTCVVMDKTGHALYFSKAVLPNTRHGPHRVYRHIGLYAYRTEVLHRFCALPQSPLEAIEKLEQLRALENGIRIKIVPVDYRGRAVASVDAPEDVGRVEAILAAQGDFHVD